MYNTVVYASIYWNIIHAYIHIHIHAYIYIYYTVHSGTQQDVCALPRSDSPRAFLRVCVCVYMEKTHPVRGYLSQHRDGILYCRRRRPVTRLHWLYYIIIHERRSRRLRLRWRRRSNGIPAVSALQKSAGTPPRDTGGVAASASSRALIYHTKPKLTTVVVVVVVVSLIPLLYYIGVYVCILYGVHVISYCIYR